jgi:hypothetical protein
MTLTDSDIDEEAIVKDDDVLHFFCCKSNPRKFICGHPYHPELESDLDTPEEKYCPKCSEICTNMLCGGVGMTPHFHCPFDEQICPIGLRA